MITKRGFLKGCSGAAVAGLVMGAAPVPDDTTSKHKQSQRTLLPDYWAWLRISSERSAKDDLPRYEQLAVAGIKGVMFEQYSEPHYRAAQAAGLQTWRWKWTMNRWEDATRKHPEWFMVNRKGESCFDKPAYVDYYRFLCPNQPQVIDYLVQDYLVEAARPCVQGVHLDYIRYPDVVLPVGLWKNYKITQERELPEYDYCYCPRCRELFKQAYGEDPLKMPFPDLSQSWRRFRYDSITRAVNRIAEALHDKGVPVTAAVFPGPEQAQRMVRQDWGRWNVDAVFPMLYNGFYEEPIRWIGDCVAEGIRVQPNLYAGIFCPDVPGDQLKAAVAEAKRNGARGAAFFDLPKTFTFQ